MYGSKIMINGRSCPKDYSSIPPRVYINKRLYIIEVGAQHLQQASINGLYND